MADHVARLAHFCNRCDGQIISTRIRVARNLSMFPLNPGGSLESRLAIADMMDKV